MKKGFTLIEMSIVLVIIGLLVAGIVGGKNLIETSKINAVVADFKKYKSAYDKFKEIYNAVPGDMSDATSVWTAATGNGNGDGRINVPYTGNPYYENVYAWNQLSLAQLIPGTYTGTGTDLSGVWFALVPDVNIPKGPYPASAYDLNCVGSWCTYEYNDVNADSLILGRSISDNDASIGYPIFFSEQAVEIDLKIDDGHPNTGQFRTNCPSDGYTYDVSNTTDQCFGYYVLGQMHS